MFPLKERVILLFLNMLIAFLMIVFTYVGVTSIIKYLSFPEVVEYSTGGVILSFSAVVLGPVFVSGFPVIIHGRRFEHKIASALNKIIISGFVLGVFTGIVFRSYYLGEIKSKGYVECYNKRAGAFSVLSTKYAMTLDGCGQ